MLATKWYGSSAWTVAQAPRWVNVICRRLATAPPRFDAVLTAGHAVSCVVLRAVPCAMPCAVSCLVPCAGCSAACRLQCRSVYGAVCRMLCSVPVAVRGAVPCMVQFAVLCAMPCVGCARWLLPCSEELSARALRETGLQLGRIPRVTCLQYTHIKRGRLVKGNHPHGCNPSMHGRCVALLGHGSMWD